MLRIIMIISMHYARDMHERFSNSSAYHVRQNFQKFEMATVQCRRDKREET